MNSVATEREPVRRHPLSRAFRGVQRTALVLIGAPLLLVLAEPAAAALLQTSSSSLAAGTAVVTECGDASAAVVSYDVIAGQVVSVSVTNIPTSCDGSRLRVTLTSNGTAVALSGPVMVTGGAAQVSALSATPSYASVTDARIVLVG